MPITTHAASSGKWGDNLTWELDDYGTLTISGDLINKRYADGFATREQAVCIALRSAKYLKQQ